jgi:hypothetical protein
MEWNILGAVIMSLLNRLFAHYPTVCQWCELFVVMVGGASTVY